LNTKTPSRPTAFWFLIFLIALNSLGGFYGGGHLVMDPTGRSIGFPPGTIDKTPFPNFLLPGLFLFVVYGIGGAAIIFGLARRRKCSPKVAMLLGATLMMWMVAQVYLLGPPIAGLQILYFLIGMAILILSRWQRFPAEHDVL
jgi:hypothetical protein